MPEISVEDEKLYINSVIIYQIKSNQNQAIYPP